MENLYFYDYEDFACEALEKFNLIQNLDSYNDISVIAKYDDAKEILRELICIGCSIRDVILENGESSDYWDEYIISISSTDNQYEVWCEPMKRENSYLEDDSTITYILDNCSSACIPYCKGSIVYEVCISEDDCNSCEPNECVYCKESSQPEKCVEYFKDNADNEDNDTHGFTVSRSDGDSWMSYSFYTTEKLSKRDIQGLLQEACL